MDRRFKWLFGLLVTAVLVTDVVGYIPFLSTRQIRVNAPVESFTYARSFLATGDAWTPAGLPPVEMRATRMATGEVLTFPAQRLTVNYRGVPVKALAIFQARIDLPQDGAWKIQAFMSDPSGAQPSGLESRARTIAVKAGAPNHLFTAFGPGHLIAFVILFALLVFVILRYRKPRGETEVGAAAFVISLVLLGGELSYHIYWVAIDGFSASNSLMLHMCGISLFLLPFLLFMKDSKARQWLFEICWFWGLGGAFQAFLAPDIWTHSFPELRFFTFFTSHGMLIIGPLFFALTSGAQLLPRSPIRVGAVTLGAAALMWGVDQLPRWIPPYEPANYFFMGYPPPTGSIIDTFADIFGPSPAYFIGIALMGIVLFSLLYLPFPIVRAAKSRAAARAEQRQR
jgi:hypothetical integral membrane protein (TIGR02206 family)